MKYMGSKNRHAKELLPIILKDRKEGQWYFEPFAGGMNMIDKVDGNRIANDINEYLIECFKSGESGSLEIPDIITEEMYHDAKKGKYEKDITGFIGFAMSFGGKWFGGYRRDVAGTSGCLDNMVTQTRRSKQSFIKQIEKLKGVMFTNKDYRHFVLNKPCIIYCDPPYESTTSYKDKFNHVEFWEWCRLMVSFGHKVFISEYNAPEDFVCVWSKEVNNTLVKDSGSKKGIEKLFVHKSQLTT